MPNRKTGANGLQNVYKPIFTGVSTMFQFQPLNWDDDTKLLAGVFVLFFTGGLKPPTIQVGIRSCLSIDYNISGWWFGTFFIFPYIGNNHPN